VIALVSGLPVGHGSRPANSKVRDSQMTSHAAPADQKAWDGPGPREFIILMAALMATNALAIDSMLPALPPIGRSLNVLHDNQRQLVVTVFLIGLGAAQLIYGPLADRFGRRPIAVTGLSFYILFALLAGIAGSFVLLLVARTFQGIAAASSRVLVVSIVRDRFHGSAMARIMSFTTIVFMFIPVLAPSLGQLVLTFANWRFIFVLLAAFASVVLLWILIRLPETLPRERRRPLSPRKIYEAVALIVSNPVSIGNTLAMTMIMGAMFGFINSIQQIMFDVFHRPRVLGLVFAGIAGMMALSAYFNARIVHRFGARPIMIIALWVFVLLAISHLAISVMIGEKLWVFFAFQALCMACVGLISANLGSIAMQPLGHVAGTASSIQGTITTLGGALIGFAIGQHFDGTTMPFDTAFVICGVTALLLALWANRERAAPAE
jgi:DHA1 family bicyclomycin/chloramphenicol resistance-like MFS transporter